MLWADKTSPVLSSVSPFASMRSSTETNTPSFSFIFSHQIEAVLENVTIDKSYTLLRHQNNARSFQLALRSVHQAVNILCLRSLSRLYNKSESKSKQNFLLSAHSIRDSVLWEIETNRTKPVDRNTVRLKCRQSHVKFEPNFYLLISLYIKF